jgi:hypothetical protein
MRFLPGQFFTLVALLALTSCDRFVPPTAPVVAVDSVPDGGGLGSDGLAQVSHPRFGGITDLVAGDGMVRIGWAPASDDETPAEQIEYLIFISPDSIPIDLDSPDFIAEGATNLTVEGLPNGEMLRVLVRALDTSGEVDSNRNEWVATPNPIRHVRSGANASGADGLTPETAFPTLAQAVATSISLQGVNLYVAEGLYPENIFLFPGMMVFGGFLQDFQVDQRDPVKHLTQFGILFPSDLVYLRPGDLLNGIDGISLAGNDIAETCVFAEDCNSRITRCRMSGATTQGIDLRSDYLEGEKIRVHIADCVVADCSGEGIRIQGIPEIRIDDCEIRDNLNEGIESQWIRAGTDYDARIEITRCVIKRNGDEGIDLDIASIDGPGPVSEVGARIRVKIRHCSIEENQLEGIVIDLDYVESDQMDVRIRIDDNRIRGNQMSGIFLDGDADAAIRISRCQISANGSDGILASGISTGPLPLVHHCNILGNGGAGLATHGLGSISAWHCWIEGNGGGLWRSLRGSITIRDSLLSSTAAPIDPAPLHYCLLEGAVLPADAPDHLISGSIEVVGRPAGYSRATILEGGTLLLHQPPPQLENLAVEIADDGSLREISSIRGPMITVDPPLIASRVAGSSNQVSVFFWPTGENPFEDCTPLPGSALIDAADPATLDIDGTPHDLGPLGANPLHFVGPDPALSDPPVQTQLRYISPAPSMPSISGNWSLSFTRDLPAASEYSISVLVDDIVRTSDTAINVDGTVIHLQIDPPPLPGQFIRLQIRPFDDDGNGNGLPRRLIFDQYAALSWMEDETTGANDSPLTAPEIEAEPVLIFATIDSASDEDWYLITPPTAGPFQVELLARRDGSLLTGLLEWYSSGGQTLLGSSQASAPFFFDPFLEDVETGPSGSILLRVSGTTDAGNVEQPYRLLLQRPGA